MGGGGIKIMRNLQTKYNDFSSIGCQDGQWFFNSLFGKSYEKSLECLNSQFHLFVFSVLCNKLKHYVFTGDVAIHSIITKPNIK